MAPNSRTKHDRNNGYYEAVLEIEEEVALAQNRLIADQAECSSVVGTCIGLRKMALRLLERIDDRQEHRKQRHIV